MYKKVCTDCHKPSFSSCETGTWLCPVCGADITKVGLQDPETRQAYNKRFEFIAPGYSNNRSQHGFTPGVSAHQ